MIKSTSTTISAVLAAVSKSHTVPEGFRAMLETNGIHLQREIPNDLGNLIATALFSSTNPATIALAVIGAVKSRHLSEEGGKKF